jgi:hypothetical protein
MVSGAKYIEKDQTLCPKCGRMYCEGFWGEGVCTADMQFSSDPTSRGDEIALYVRVWYEANRETFWDRYIWKFHKPWTRGLADEFMLAYLQEVRRVEAEAERQSKRSEIAS